MFHMEVIVLFLLCDFYLIFTNNIKYFFK